MRRAGYVLTGGNSSRMGQDKALLSYEGSPLVVRVAQIVKEAVGNVTLAGAVSRYSNLGIPAIGDRYPGCGPLGGILTALLHSTSEWNLVVACDMPLLDARFLVRLLDYAGRSESDAVLARNSRGQPEPLCAVYRNTCRAQFAHSLETRNLKIMEALRPLQVDFLNTADDDLLTNANTPEDWSRLQLPREVKVG